ncbi:hypothetical protein [Coralloluteibacterium stylophorae]|uniref:Uncharacterized protein n=1 Tax=Coralloluteibacterium stylophorae TaxID=1776034 RepID=A0A8J7VUU4_9GAMM|nr:hypothetical protein [Coralloluteibacterium stylophorae]MBS7456683.1 hypothetical protein [Coralloluteibacterium stylophorae]
MRDTARPPWRRARILTIAALLALAGLCCLAAVWPLSMQETRLASSAPAWTALVVGKLLLFAGIAAAAHVLRRHR